MIDILISVIGKISCIKEVIEKFSLVSKMIHNIRKLKEIFWELSLDVNHNSKALSKLMSIYVKSKPKVPIKKRALLDDDPKMHPVMRSNEMRMISRATGHINRAFYRIIRKTDEAIKSNL